MTSTTAGGKTLAYQYDPAGNRTRTTWPEATAFYITASYDALNRPTALLENGTVSLASNAYDDLSRRTTVTLGNGTTTGYGYTTQSALASLTQNLAGTAQDNTWSYTRNQVQDIKAASWTNDSYQWTGYTNGTRNYTTNGLNQYTAAHGATLNYDANGNLDGDGVWTYAYNLDNQLTSANKTGSANSLAYDGAGRLSQTTLAGVVTNLSYDGSDLVTEYNSTGTLLRRYVHGPGVDQPLVWYEGAVTTAKTWLYSDHQGSIVATANSAGTSTATLSYGPYGEPNATTGVRFRYTGQQLLGPLNLYYYKARMYSPALGRFLQTDPIGYQDGLNLYAYVGNNPFNRNDPSGLIAADARMLASNYMTELNTTASAFGDAVSARPALQSFAVGSTLGGGIGLATAYPLATGLTLTSLELSSLASGDMPVGIPTINGRLPINSSYAGQIHPSGIPFTSQGFPDFSSVTKAEVQIQSLTGNYAKDSALANQAVGISQTPTGFVWHHVEDGLTMQLISQDIHNAVRHTGGAAVIRNGGFD